VNDAHELERLVFQIVGDTAVECVRAGHDENDNPYVSLSMGVRRYKITAKSAACPGWQLRSLEYQLREFRDALNVVESHRIF
jgi:hypothetical protein